MTAIRVSNSKLKTYRRCEKQYDYKYVQKLRPKKRSRSLELGSWVHELMMVHYDGEDWREKHKELEAKFHSMFEEEQEDVGRDLPIEALRLMTAYVRHYKDEDRQWDVVDTELDEIITLPNGIELQIIVDLIVQERRSRLLWAWDHKNRKKFADADAMSLDPQLSLYYWGLEQLGYKPMGGVGYNEVLTKPPAIPQMLKSGRLSKRANIFTTAEIYAQAVKDAGFELKDYKDIILMLKRQPNKFFRRTRLPKDPPVLKVMVEDMVDTVKEIQTAEARGRFPRTFLSACKWDCDYKDLCIVDLHGGDSSSLVKMNFERRNRGKGQE